jgi:hypothetical protein
VALGRTGQVQTLGVGERGRIHVRRAGDQHDPLAGPDPSALEDEILPGAARVGVAVEAKQLLQGDVDPDLARAQTLEPSSALGWVMPKPGPDQLASAA